MCSNTDPGQACLAAKNALGNDKSTPVFLSPVCLVDYTAANDNMITLKILKNLESELRELLYFLGSTKYFLNWGRGRTLNFVGVFDFLKNFLETEFF